MEMEGASRWQAMARAANQSDLEFQETHGTAEHISMTAVKQLDRLRDDFDHAALPSDERAARSHSWALNFSR